jgi:hypothetical protein
VLFWNRQLLSTNVRWRISEYDVMDVGFRYIWTWAIVSSRNVASSKNLEDKFLPSYRLSFPRMFSEKNSVKNYDS